MCFSSSSCSSVVEIDYTCTCWIIYIGDTDVYEHSIDDMSDEEPTTTPVGTVAAVNIKLLLYWASDPQVWFAQVEAQLNTCSITVQKIKFDHIIASLSPEIATKVRDLILAPPTEKPYNTLKAQLIKQTAASEQWCLQQLFNAEELGDRKPTQFLRQMQQLFSDKAGSTNSSFVRKLFLQCLHANLRMVLASTTDITSLEDLAQLVDKIVEVAIPSAAALRPPKCRSWTTQDRGHTPTRNHEVSII